MEHDVHHLHRQTEEEFFGSLRQRIRVRARRAADDRVRHMQVFGELVDLRFVDVRDRLEVGEPIAALHKEALIMLEAVRRAGDGIVQPVGVEVLDHLPHALLEVRRGNDLPIFDWR